jgi:hypothetical protein
VQARAEDLDRFAEALINPAALQGHFMHAGQRQPTASTTSSTGKNARRM